MTQTNRNTNSFLKRNVINLIIIGLTIINLYLIINYLFVSSGLLLYLILFGIPCIGLGIYKRLKPKRSSIETNKDVFTEQKIVGNCVKCGSIEDLVFYIELEPILDSVKRIHIRKFYSATIYKYKGAIEKRLITCPKCKMSFDKWRRISFILFSMIFVSLVVVSGISLIIFILQELDPEGTTNSGNSFITMIISLIVSIILIIIYIIHSRSKSNPKHYFPGG